MNLQNFNQHLYTLHWQPADICSFQRHFMSVPNKTCSEVHAAAGLSLVFHLKFQMKPLVSGTSVPILSREIKIFFFFFLLKILMLFQRSNYSETTLQFNQCSKHGRSSECKQIMATLQSQDHDASAIQCFAKGTGEQPPQTVFSYAVNSVHEVAFSISSIYRCEKQHIQQLSRSHSKTETKM